MHSDATTVDAYIDSLPDARREAILTVRRTIAENLPDGLEESIAHGMIAWSVPLAAHPDT
jgi:hypothetical protein